MRISIVCLFCVVVCSVAFAQQTSDPLMPIMKAELDRAATKLKSADPAPYFISYTVNDDEQVFIAAVRGALVTSARARLRQGSVSVRVGSRQLDNTHGEGRITGISAGLLPVEDDAFAIAHELWQLTDRQYKQAVQTFLRAKTRAAVRAKEEDDSPDFSEEGAASIAAKQATPVPPSPDQRLWEGKVKRLSARFNSHPFVYESVVLMTISRPVTRFVSTEGTAVSTARPIVRISVMGRTTAEDGMQLIRAESFEAASVERLPNEAEMEAKIDTMAKDLVALRNAPTAEPFNGPALLSGRSAAVFFHEVLGHRLEGQRQRGDDEGQTFTKQVGKSVLPEFLSIVDDPTVAELGNVPLLGNYDFDDEGQPAQKVNVIENGVLKTFLMSRMPIKGFNHSNGHGRAQPGFMQAGRQGNLIVSSSRTVSEAQLRKQFVDEIKKQNKPYGLYFEDIQGGFTLTNRMLPQSFQVLPVMVWRVFADGRPDELVRGVDIVGTPLAALNRIVMTGDKQLVFNGICGAESGQVPVSAAAPAMLFSEIEVQKKAKEQERPPILPPPLWANAEVRR